MQLGAAPPTGHNTVGRIQGECSGEGRLRATWPHLCQSGTEAGLTSEENRVKKYLSLNSKTA